MSLGRQRHNTRVNSRANTLPSLSNTTVDTDTSVTTIDTSNTFLPSIEESLQDWISRSIPDTPSSSISYMLESCRCCNESDCENFETLASTIRKLDSDARLAAGKEKFQITHLFFFRSFFFVSLYFPLQEFHLVSLFNTLHSDRSESVTKT